MRTVVGVLRGGPSSKYDASLRSGAHIIAALDKDKYEPRDIFIDRQGVWHSFGAPVGPERALRGVDVALNIVHGDYGEAGQLHDILDSLAVPYSGSDKISSALAFNKVRSKQAVKKAGIKTPRALLVSRDEMHDPQELAFTIFRTFLHPAVVKPVMRGASPATLVDNFQALAWALEQALAVAEQALVEEYIRGREASVGVIDNFRGEKTYALLPVEIAAHSVRVPGNFTAREKDELMDAARSAHEALGLSHYSNNDFIVARRGIYFLGARTAPSIELGEQAVFPQALDAVGAKMPTFLDHVVSLAQGGRKVKIQTA